MKATDFKWGIGIEHEMHLFHIPNSKIINSIIAFDSHSVVKRLLKNYQKLKLKKEDVEFLESIPFEISGRTCNGIKIINKIPINMPELITAYPFCSVNRERTKRAIEDIYEYKIKLIKLLKKDSLTKKLIKKYGELNEYPFGMSRYIKYGKIKNNTYIFNKNKKEDILYTDYTGSYHITLTLPYTEKTTNKEFIEMHQNFCNQLQWVEPLMIHGFFSGDEYAPGSKYDRARGSYRMMNIGWGNIAGSDVRLFNKGIGRYAKTKIYWRENFLLHETNKLKPCIKPSPYARKEGGITSYGTDFRTFGENQKGIRVSGYPMNKPNGIEIRIFDNFDSKYLRNLLFFLFLMIQNSFQTKTKDYVYQNKTWIKNIREIMKYGYSSSIDNKYVDLINKKLKINIVLEENVNIYNCLLKALYKKNKNGFYFNLLSGLGKNSLYKKLIPINAYYMKINEFAWDFALCLKLIRNPLILNKFNQFLQIIIYLGKIKVYEIYKLINIVLGVNWKNDVKNILMYLKNMKFISYKNIDFKNNTIYVEKNRYFNELSAEYLSYLVKNMFSKSSSINTFVPNNLLFNIIKNNNMNNK